ncbi:MAG: hypothetical protein KAS82_01095 [Bacteroidales bacterium]|nr:hypothetical protein [Bacteroidales bacterium]
MSSNPIKLSHFWQELKRRKVTRVITVYAAAAFVILEVSSIIVEPLKLPEWTLTMVIVLLCIGFVIAVILSWIYDATPTGIEKTKPVVDVQHESAPATSNGWKIASYISFLVIAGLILIHIVAGSNRSEVSPELEKSIAVLPFHNFSTDTEQEYMCYGLTDEIMNHLYKIESFDKVVSLTSILNYKDSEKNITEIAEELGVNFILEGTYTKIGEQLRVTAKLIEASTDKRIWQNEYDQPYKEIIAIQSDIALQIADHVKVYLTDNERQKIEKIPTTNQEAYELLQQAIYTFSTLESPTVDPIISLAQKAIELDPEYANAYAWAGIWNLYLGVYAGTKEITSAVWEATPFLEKALELDKNSSAAHLGMANIYEWVKWDFIKAEEEYVKINELEPNKPMNYDLLAQFYLKMNRLDDALLFPFSSSVYLNTIPFRAHFLKGNKTEANRLIDSMSEVYRNSGNWINYCEIGDAYIWNEEFDSALVFLESAMANDTFYIMLPRFQAGLALAYYKTSKAERARSIIKNLIQKSDKTAAGSPAYYTGWFYSWIGDGDSAFYWLEKAYENRSPEFPWLKVDPAFDNLKENDRYWDLYERTGHKAYDDFMASQSK